MFTKPQCLDVMCVSVTFKKVYSLGFSWLFVGFVVCLFFSLIFELLFAHFNKMSGLLYAGSPLTLSYIKLYEVTIQDDGISSTGPGIHELLRLQNALRKSF